jgi:hypothetical protein
MKAVRKSKQKETDDNVYLRMPLDRVKQDALAGVSLARQMWRARDPDAAGRMLGFVIEPNQQKPRQKEQKTGNRE